MQSYATLKIGESMKKLDKKTKKKIYFALILVGLDLLLMGILCIVSNYIPSIPKGIVLGPFGILLWSFIINLVSSIYFLISGIKIKEKILICLALLLLIPIPTWFFAGSQIINNVPLEYSWDKPVLYLYPEQEENVTVTFEHPENLLTTYPKYEAKWEVTATPEGNLYDENGKYYYALYWDEKSIVEEEFDEGFFVTKENAIEFLETTLTQIGLTRREQNEFIMYWLPILEQNKKSIVNYTLTEERQEENELMITPKPDSLLRVAINIKKVDKEVKIEEQELPHFTREGFTAVEWGGSVR